MLIQIIDSFTLEKLVTDSPLGDEELAEGRTLVVLKVGALEATKDEVEAEAEAESARAVITTTISLLCAGAQRGLVEAAVTEWMPPALHICCS